MSVKPAWAIKSREAMKRKKYKYADLGDAVGLTYSGVSHQFNGRRSVSFHQMQTYAQMLDLSLNELVDSNAVFTPSEQTLTERINKLLKNMTADQLDAAHKIVELFVNNRG